MSYSIEQIQEPRISFGSYRYRIFKEDREVAVFSHDYRGECEGIKILEKKEFDAPFAMCSHFLTGGGPEPLGLSDKAIEFLDSQLNENK